jgi:hypothetical protein
VLSSVLSDDQRGFESPTGFVRFTREFRGVLAA